MSKIIHSEKIETFPFARMSRAMRTLNWKWIGIDIPTAEDLALEASRMFKEVQKHDRNSISSGGLRVLRDGTVEFESKSGKYKVSLKAWQDAKGFGVNAR